MTKIDRTKQPNVIMPDEIRPALGDMEAPLDEQEPRGADEFEDGTAAERVIRPGADED